MAWTTPKTWTSEPLTSEDMNTHLRDNLNAIKSPPTDVVNIDQGTDYSKNTYGAWSDLNTNDLALSITPTGDTVLIGFSGGVTYRQTETSYKYAFFDVYVDGIGRLGGADGLAVVQLKTHSSGVWEENSETVTFLHLLTGVTPGQTLNMRLQIKTTWHYAIVHGDASGGIIKTAAQFWAREVS